MISKQAMFLAGAIAATLFASAPAAQAGQIHMVLFEHQQGEDATAYGAMTLVAPSAAVTQVSGRIDDDRLVHFGAAENGMHVGATWGRSSMENVVAELSGAWELDFTFADTSAEQATAGFTFNGDALDIASLNMPVRPEITGVAHEGGDLQIDWMNHDPDTAQMVAGAIDWNNALSLVTDLPSAESSVIPGIEQGDYELLVGAMTFGPAGVLEDFNDGGLEWSAGTPTLWLGNATTQAYSVVPEPGSLALLGLAGAALLKRRRRHA